MKEQLIALQKKHNDLKELLFDIVLTMESDKYQREFGMNEKELYSKARSIVMGTPHNPLDFDMRDVNGSQGE